MKKPKCIVSYAMGVQQGMKNAKPKEEYIVAIKKIAYEDGYTEGAIDALEHTIEEKK